MLLQSRFARHSVAIYMFQAVAMASGFVTSLVLARTLGSAGKGSVDLFLLLVTLVVEIGLLGVPFGLLYLLANKRLPIARVHGDAIVAALTLGSLGLILAFVAPGAFAALVGGMPMGYAFLALAVSGFYAYSSAWGTMMIGVDRAPMMNFAQAVAGLLIAGACGVSWLAGVLSADAAIAIIVAVGIGVAVGRYVVASRLHHGVRPRPTLTSGTEALRYGLRLFPGSIANWLHFRIDQLVIANVIGVAGVGVYTVSVRWAELLWVVGFGLLNAGMFRIASSPKSSSYAFTVKLFWAILTVSTGAGLLLAAGAAPAISFLYGPEFTGAVLPLLILIPGVVAWGSARVLSNYLSYNRGQPLIPTVVALFGAGLNIVGNLFAVPRYGIEGAAATSTFSYLFVLIVTGVVFLRTGSGGTGAAPDDETTGSASEAPMDFRLPSVNIRA